MHDATDRTDEAPGKLSRRNVMVGSAWAVPVVMGVGAAPAMAQSVTVDASVSYSANGKLTLTFTVTGRASGDSLTITISPGVTWSGHAPDMGPRTLTADSTTISGKINTGLTAAGDRTVTFVYTHGGSTTTVTKSFTV